MMWHYCPRGPLENRVLKTWFIIQKNFKNHPSLKHNLTSPDRIRSERESDQIRERVRLERGRPDKRERKSQIREREKEIAWVARPRPREPRCATQVRDLGCATQGRDLGLFLVLRFLFFSPSGSDFFFGWCCFVIYELSIKSLRLDFQAVNTWKMMPHQMWLDHENRVLKTRFTVQNRVS